MIASGSMSARTSTGPIIETSSVPDGAPITQTAASSGVSPPPGNVYSRRTASPTGVCTCFRSVSVAPRASANPEPMKPATKSSSGPPTDCGETSTAMFGVSDAVVPAADGSRATTAGVARSPIASAASRSWPAPGYVAVMSARVAGSARSSAPTCVQPTGTGRLIPAAGIATDVVPAGALAGVLAGGLAVGLGEGVGLGVGDGVGVATGAASAPHAATVRITVRAAVPRAATHHPAGLTGQP